MVVNVHSAKTNLSKLLKQVSEGEEVIIARAGRPIAKIVPLNPTQDRIAGAWRGKFSVPESFFEPLTSDQLAAWEGI